MGVARLLQSELRVSDSLFRYGGEEFAVVLPPETTCKGAFVLGERFRRAVQRAPWPKRPISISIGVAATDADTTSPQDLLQAADRALYQAKQSGGIGSSWRRATASTSDRRRTAADGSGGPCLGCGPCTSAAASRSSDISVAGFFSPIVGRIAVDVVQHEGQVQTQPYVGATADRAAAGLSSVQIGLSGQLLTYVAAVHLLAALGER